MAGLIEKARGVLEDPGLAATHVVGKAGIKGLAEYAGPTLMPAFVGGGMKAALFAAPLAGALSSGLVVVEYLHKKDKLTDQYRNQIARWKSKETGIPTVPSQITSVDLDRAIEHNSVLGETVDQARKERNWGMGISAASSVLSTIVVSSHELPLIGHTMHDFLHQGMLAGDEPMTNVARMLVGGLIGFAMYIPISAGMHWVAEHLFGLEKKTANDHIKEIKRDRGLGKEISQEQVLDAFVKAAPELDHAIKEEFGKRFCKLNDAQRHVVVEMVGKQMGLPELTQAINKGMPPEELAFTESSPITGIVQARQVAFGSAGAGMANVREQENAAGHAEEKPRTSFASRVGRKQMAGSFTQSVGRREAFSASNSFTEGVDQSRSNPEVQLG